jgi:hypothetical protein
VVEKGGRVEIKSNILPREASESSFKIGSWVNAILPMWYRQIIHNTTYCGFENACML